MKRAVLYVRVSTGRQEVENQVLQLRQYAERAGYRVCDVYADVMSGRETSRPRYDDMFLDARRLAFDIVIFWDVSRFSRAGTWHTLNKLKELENLGIEWHSFQEPYFSSAGQFKDVVLSILATVASMERQKISERTKAGLERARKRGAKIGKRGKDKKRRKSRCDRGKKRVGSKTTPPSSEK